jgi:hypothetical protein
MLTRLSCRRAAILDAFFPGDTDRNHGQILLGSIKAVLSHTEGTAGLVRVLRHRWPSNHGHVLGNPMFAS